MCDLFPYSIQMEEKKSSVSRQNFFFLLVWGRVNRQSKKMAHFTFEVN